MCYFGISKSSDKCNDNDFSMFCKNSYHFCLKRYVCFQGLRGPNGTVGAIGKPGPKVGERIEGYFLNWYGCQDLITCNSCAIILFYFHDFIGHYWEAW